MKKVILYSLTLMMSLSFWSCKDDDNKTVVGEVSDRLPRPMLMKDDNTGKGDSYPYNCAIVNINSASLYWYTVEGAKAYELKWAVQNYVANGEDAWLEAERNENKKSLEGHIVITDPQQYHIVLEHLQYQTDLRFAIRALNSFDPTGYSLFNQQAGVYDILNSGDAAWKNDSKNSLWYGYGNGRQWADYLGLQTGARYSSPRVFQVSDRQDESMRINLNRVINPSDYAADQLADFREHFNFLDADQTIVKVDYLTFTASFSTPAATENSTYVRYDITDADWERGYIIVDGLSKNSVYDIKVWDASIPYEADAWVTSDQKRTTGPAGPPILITHIPNQYDTANVSGTDYIEDISAYQSMKLDHIIRSYYSDITLAENQVFYLEGGKAYHFTDNPDLYKGFTLRTNPEDLAQGKRAKLYMGGIQRAAGNPKVCNFMLGRQPASGEDPTILMDIDSIRFIDLDIDVPMARNIGDGSADGNYFMNMYSNGMGINVTLLEWNNCTFQGLIRGFFRTQGSNDFFCKHMKLIDCEFYNCGYYNANGGDYGYLYVDHGSKPKSNLCEDIEVSGNVFYNNPKRALLNDANRNVNWAEDIRWNIDVHHNTFVNFNCNQNNDQNSIFYLTTLPAGSTIGFHDNVYILTKDVNDSRRSLNTRGWYTNRCQGGDGTGKCTFNIYNNWTTDDSYVWNNGALFGNRAFEATSNAPGAFYKSWGEVADTYFPHGQSELAIKVDKSLKATDLMASPNPKYMMGATAAHNDWHSDNGIDGLYYQQTSTVTNSDIYKSGAGAPKLRNGK